MNRAKLGVIFFLISEAMFFVMLIIAYVAFHNASPNGPRAENTLDPQKTAVFTALLLASSGTIWLCERASRAGKFRAARGWLAFTIALGLTFLIGQGMEYRRLLLDHVTMSSSLFATSFFTLTGFHGLHVFIGLILLGMLLALEFAPAFQRLRESALSSISLYWHFVDVVWIAVFSVVYLRLLL
jgi:heme/copper-type cytochrome/quinol oxidase subunit 3